VTQLLDKYPGKIRVAFKHFPIEGHNAAPLAHRASMAAQEQGKFWEMHDRIFANQQKMSRDQYLAYAKELKLDVAKFTQALDSGKFKPQIDADQADAKALGVTGTPAFFVNGKFLNGAKPFEDFATVINAELKRLNLPIPPGAPQS